MGEQGAFRAVGGLEHQRAGLQMRISGTVGNNASAAQEMLPRVGMDGSEQPFKSTEQNVCLGLALNIRNLKYKDLMLPAVVDTL